MSDKPGKQDTSTRFKKGQSGNPKGRPRGSGKKFISSSFNVLIDLEIPVGSEQKLSVAEALQFKRYNQALQGNRAAQRDIVNMIVERDEAVAKRSKQPVLVEILAEHDDPTNAYDALLLLGIARLDPKWNEGQAPADDRYKR